jgi:hypothetical protein
MPDTAHDASTRSTADAADRLLSATAAPLSALPGWEVGVAPFGLIMMTLFAVGVGIITGIGSIFSAS